MKKMKEYGDKFVSALLRRGKKQKVGPITLDEAKRSRNYLALYQQAIRYRTG